MAVMDEWVERVDEHDRVQELVTRDEAVRNGWLHRVASCVCRDERGRFLVHRRSEHVSRFPGRFEAMIGGAVEPGETYGQAAVRELGEELGVQVPVHFLHTFLNRSGISPHWLGLHEAEVPAIINPATREIDWYGWLTEPELRQALGRWHFTPDSQVTLDRYFAHRPGAV
ncbi:NTP pyrophosphohydrolase [Streptomyces sp. NWU49]|nr:NUDIX domain-containing protein [Streptomyces sp. NWU49]PWJ02365.1 NTP pyrophosphohydrolase [Streptomyces sp. NWU49]